ncbi:MAG: alkaline phosphatase D family protein [Polyangiales bacterium]
MKLTRRRFVQLAGAVCAVACADEEVYTPDPIEDAGPDPTYDAMPIDPDAGDDAGDDAAVDAAPAEDAAPDAALDAARDASLDARADAAPDVVRLDAAPDVARVDAARPDVARDAGMVADPDFRSLPERAAQFPLGVMAGDATDTSVIFWTRYAGTGAVRLRVLEMNGARIAAVRFDGAVDASSAGYVRAVVNGLRANKQHLYAFLVGPAGAPTGRSLVGRVQTAPAPDALVPLVFGGTSCTNQRHRPFPALQHAGGRDDLDFFIHAGDHVYTDYADNAATLAQYRAKYEQNWTSAGLRALHRSTGMYLTWDDHEVLNNWDPETLSAARLAAARQAFFEHRATRRNAAAPERIWRSFRWGRTAEIFVLDCRSERLPSTRSTNVARRSQYISRAQMDWLKAGLRASPCVFKFIVNSVPIVDRAGADADNWNGYASQRQEILRHIDSNRLRGVVWLSGDVHFGGVCKVEPTGPFADIWEVIMGPAGADRDGRPPLRDGQWPVSVIGTHNYTVLRADPATRTLRAEFVNGAGNVIAGSRWSHTF